MNEFEIINNCNLKITIQRDRMVEAYQKVISGKKIVVEEEVEAETLMSEEEILHFAKGSLDQILSYGEINAEEAERFDENLCKFGRLRDRFSTEDDVRMLRKHILDDFAQALADVAVVDKAPKVEGRSMTMFLTEKR